MDKVFGKVLTSHAVPSIGVVLTPQVTSDSLKFAFILIQIKIKQTKDKKRLNVYDGNRFLEHSLT